MNMCVKDHVEVYRYILQRNLTVLVPGPPIISSLDVVTPSSLLVTWERPPQPNGIITRYKTEWRYENQNYSAYVNGNESNYEITGLTACVFHEISVMAETIKGFGVRSCDNTSMAVGKVH